jgi:cytochrome c peroxidase
MITRQFSHEGLFLRRQATLQQLLRDTGQASMRCVVNKTPIIGVLFVVLLMFAVPISAFADDNDALLGRAKQFFGPLPSAMTSAANPITPGKVRLGKMLFYEWRISSDGTVSCNRCHQFNFYATDALKKAIGVQCRENPRNSPTVLNAADQIAEHWIGNRKSVEDQAMQAVLGKAAYGMPSYESVVNRLRELGYGPLFKDAFPGEKDPVSMDNFAKAIGAFERTLVTPSPFDAYLKGETNALTEMEKKGLETFIETGCMTCHSGTYVGGQMYQKFGIFAPYWDYTKSKPVDVGRYAVTKNEADKYVFKVPLLRNVEKTAPYFHDGSVDKLEEAVFIMAKIQLGKTLSTQQRDEIVAFLNSLTGELSDEILKVPLLPAKD